MEWLSELCGGDPEAFSDELLRDRIDELVFDDIFGPERRKPYEHLFAHLCNPGQHSAASTATGQSQFRGDIAIQVSD